MEALGGPAVVLILAVAIILFTDAALARATSS